MGEDNADVQAAAPIIGGRDVSEQLSVFDEYVKGSSAFSKELSILTGAELSARNYRLIMPGSISFLASALYRARAELKRSFQDYAKYSEMRARFAEFDVEGSYAELFNAVDAYVTDMNTAYAEALRAALIGHELGKKSYMCIDDGMNRGWNAKLKEEYHEEMVDLGVKVGEFMRYAKANTPEALEEASARMEVRAQKVAAVGADLERKQEMVDDLRFVQLVSRACLELNKDKVSRKELKSYIDGSAESELRLNRLASEGKIGREESGRAILWFPISAVGGGGTRGVEKEQSLTEPCFISAVKEKEIEKKEQLSTVREDNAGAMGGLLGCAGDKDDLTGAIKARKGR